jgi:hypothetical protein
MLDQAIKGIVDAASRNAPQAEYVPMAVQLLPEGIAGMLYDDNWWPQFTAMVPTAAPYSNWFAVLRSLLIAEYDRMDADPNYVTPPHAPAAPPATPPNTGGGS